MKRLFSALGLAAALVAPVLHAQGTVAYTNNTRIVNALQGKAAYAAATTYAVNDVVTYNGGAYLSLVASNAGNTPSSSPASWMLLGGADANLAAAAPWAANTTYTLGTILTNAGSTYVVNVASFTTGASFATTNLTLIAAQGGQPYVGPIATKAYTASNTAGGFTSISTVMASFTRTAVLNAGVQFLFANFYTSSNESAPTGTATIKVTLEYPFGSGTLYPCTFGGVSSVTAAAYAFVQSDGCGPAMPNNAKFGVRTYYFNTGGIIYTDLVQLGTGELTAYTNSATPVDFTGGSNAVPSGATSGATNGFRPLAILGATTQPTVCLYSDSTGVGVADKAVAGVAGSGIDASYDIGAPARIIGPVFGYSNLSTQGDGIVAASTHETYRLQAMARINCSHAMMGYGINDLQGGSTVAQITAARTAFAAAFGKPVYGMTVRSKATTSSDNWASTANQTVTTDATALDAAIRLGIPGEVGVIDIQRAMDPNQTNVWPVSPNPFATTGTAQYGTPDGIHGTSATERSIAQTLGYVTNWFKR